MAILTEAVIKKAIQEAVQKTVIEVMGRLRRKIERAAIIDNIIEKMIPRQYSGYSRDKMRSLVKKYLKENHEI